MIPPSLVFLRALWFPILLLLIASNLPSTRAEEAIITLLKNPLWSYRAELADFGYILDQRLRYNANFMTPNETQLCSFPNISMLQLDRASRLSKPVALLVSLGGCDTAKKVEVALQIHKKVTNFLRFIVFYNNDPNNPDEIFHVHPPPNTTMYLDDLEEMSFSAISTATSAAILAEIADHSQTTGKTADFLGVENDGWMLEMIIETAANPYANTRTTSDTMGHSNFYWFRIVLFALLVLSPFCRAMFLWWTGGGRIRLRRNEQGRIVGFLYTPPMAYWFVSHGTQEPEPVADTMTTEEVMALPEIVYKPPPSEANTTTESDDWELDHGNKAVAEHEDDGRLIKVVDRTSATLNASTRTEMTSAGDIIPMTTCSTACSICIDDFEAGEKIRLLPCGHAFHTDCILPWLTRRQGCCPMCKKSVIVDEETNTAAESTPFSRCLENNSGMDSIEESAAIQDRHYALGGAEMSRDENNHESTNLPDVTIMVDPEQGEDQLANAVVNGFADSLKSDLSLEVDPEAGETSQIPPANDLGAASEGVSKMESDLLAMKDSKAGVKNVESSNNHNDMETPNRAELPKGDMPTATENDDAVSSDVDQHDLSSEIDNGPATSLDKQTEPILELATTSAVTESDSAEGEVHTAVTLPDEIKLTGAQAKDLEG